MGNKNSAVNFGFLKGANWGGSGWHGLIELIWSQVRFKNGALSSLSFFCKLCARLETLYV